MSVGDEIIVNSRRFDLSIRRSWKCRLVESDPPMIVLAGEFDRTVEHEHLGNISRGTVSFEYYWLDRWYNVFRFHEPGGRLRNYYCNVNMPPAFTDGVLDYIDLDIDLLVWPDGSIHLLDRHDFDQSAERYGFSPELIASVDKAISELLTKVRERAFPFDQA